MNEIKERGFQIKNLKTHIRGQTRKKNSKLAPPEGDYERLRNLLSNLVENSFIFSKRAYFEEHCSR